MDTSSPPDELPELLRHTDWIRRLAGELVRDSASADDLAQSTWLAVLERPPRLRGDPRPFLASVLRNQARQRIRGERRRRHREQDTARPEALEGPEELVGRVHRQRELAGHVLELDEPFRTTLILRFFGDLAPRQIAERMNVPIKTVHSRIARGLDRLRTSLDHAYDDRAQWMSAFAPLALLQHLKTPSAAAAALHSGGWLLKTWTKAALLTGLLAIGVGGAAWLTSGQPEQAHPRSVEDPVLLAAPETLGESHIEEVLVEPKVLDRRAVETVAESETSQEPAASGPPKSLMLAGRILDPEGQGIPNAVVFDREVPNRELGQSTVDGSFEVSMGMLHLIRRTAQEIQLRADKPGWTVLRGSSLPTKGDQREHLIVMARETSLEGRVVDSGDRPIPGARVEFHGMGGVLIGFPVPLDQTWPVEFSASTDEFGHFGIDPFPELDGMTLVVTSEGFLPANVDLDNTARPLVIQLVAQEERVGQRVKGLVLDPMARPVSGALVELGGTEVLSGHDGSFELIPGRLSPEVPLCASLSGHLPALIDNFGARLADKPGDPDPVQLILGGEPLRIKARLVKFNGDPAIGWAVHVQDETVISQFQLPARTAEGLFREQADSIRTNWVGRFEITGLYPRDYRVLFLDEHSLRSHEVVLSAGSDETVIQMPASRTRRLSGRTVDRDGRAVPGVEISLGLDTFRNSVGNQSTAARETLTDQQGRFEFDEVPVERVHLQIGGQSVLPDRAMPEGEGDLDLDLLVIRRCHFHIESTLADDASWRFAMLDQDGQTLQLTRFAAFGMTSFSLGDLAEGGSETLAVSELAATLQLYRNGKPERQIPIQLNTESVTTLRL